MNFGSVTFDHYTAALFLSQPTILMGPALSKQYFFLPIVDIYVDIYFVQEMKTYDTGEISGIYRDKKWEQECAAFKDYGPGVRSVYLESKGM